jgi:carbamoyl-phosphate synthase large subunit
MFTIFTEEELTYYIKQLEENNSQEKMWPLLVDRYMPGLECEVDVISDGINVIIPGIFEHIERAGVHSGDSISVFPPVSLAKEIKATLIEYAEKIAQSAPIVGMMNIQFVIYQDQVLVLEVNPRSSRTVPIMSKVTGVPMIEWAVMAQMGISLHSLSSDTGLLTEPNYYSVKSPVFSRSKLKGVDHVLGPEMKSTGEVLGLGTTFHEALDKAFPATSGEKESYLFCSISDREKQASLAILQQFVNANYKLAATEGTASFLQANGITIEKIVKDTDGVNELFQNNTINAVINIPNQGRNKIKFGFYIREQATRYNVPVFTHLDTVEALIGLQTQSVAYSEVRTVTEYYKIKESGVEHVKCN